MNSTLLAATEQVSLGWIGRLRVYVELTKPRIAGLVLMTVAVAGLRATWGQPAPWLLAWAVVGTALVAGSASVWNQWLERDRDARMLRTRRRPIPSGRVGPNEAVLLSLVLLLVGLAVLLSTTNLAAASLGLLTWLLYIALYTPLKTRTTWNTAIGAVAGAMPVAIGWVACGGRLGFELVALWLVVFLWQFPHFMAIAWLYREDYRRGGYRMMSVVDPSGQAAGVQAVLGAVSLLPVTLVLVVAIADFMAPWATVTTACGVFGLGLIQLFLAVAFLHRPTNTTARWLLRGSLIYLPLVLLLLACGPIF